MVGGQHSVSAAHGDLSSESSQEAVEDPGVDGQGSKTPHEGTASVVPSKMLWLRVPMKLRVPM